MVSFISQDSVRYALVLSEGLYITATGVAACVLLSAKPTSPNLAVRIDVSGTPYFANSHLWQSLSAEKCKRVCDVDISVTNDVLLRLVKLTGADKSLLPYITF